MSAKVEPNSNHVEANGIDYSISEAEEATRRNYYVGEYVQLFTPSPDYVKSLKQSGIDGDLRSCRFRSICWRVFLDCLPHDRSEWLHRCKVSRKEYDEIVSKYYTNPYKAAEAGDCSQNNPLSQEESSPWNIYFQDNELKLTIKQDVVRTFPEVDFFQTGPIQTSMSNILFHFAKENPKLGYKQGMHEVLAPILFVVHSDQQAYLHASEIHLLSDADTETCNELKEILDPTYAEHDAYLMFSQIMDVIESWYTQDTPYLKTDCINVQPFSNSSESSAPSYLSIKLQMIFEQVLKKKDAELYFFFQNMQIAPQVFGIRWLRLLFGREFSVQDLLVVWDAMFADGLSSSLCDYIFAAMLIVIRRFLITSSYSQCMTYLMKYPNVPDVHYIINLAFHLRDPLNYCQPTDYSPHVIPVTQRVPVEHSIRSYKVSSNKSTECPTQSNSTGNSMSVKKAVRPRTLSLMERREVDSIPTVAKAAAAAAAATPTRKALKPLVKEMENMDVLGSSNESKINYCWELLTEQIKVLQKCLSEETNLKHEDSIFVALAELKRARDILKGTLRFSEESED